MIKLVFKGQMPSGKNAQKIDPRSFRKYPTSKFQAWRSDFQAQVWRQWGRLAVMFPKGRVAFLGRYFPGDLIMRDMTGIMDAFFHAAEKRNGGCIVENDVQFKVCMGWEEMPVDRENPRLELELEGRP